MACETRLFYGKHVFIYGTRSSHITGGPQNDQIRYSRTDKECKENDPSSTAAKEPCVFSEIKSITVHLYGFTFIYAETVIISKVGSTSAVITAAPSFLNELEAIVVFVCLCVYSFFSV